MSLLLGKPRSTNFGILTPMSSLKLYSWNVNGIRAVMRKDTFLPFIEKHQPDVLCLQETKAQPDQVELEVPGYHIYWNSAEKKGYSGTLIMSKVEPLSVHHGLKPEIAQKYHLMDDYGDSETEGRMMTAEFEKFYVVTVYTPNSKDDLSRIPLRHDQWDPAFLAHCKDLERLKPVLFCGDLNVAHTEDDLARPKPNIGKRGFTNEEREGFDRIVEAGFIDTFRIFTQGNGHYSWWSNFGNARANNTGWRIDYWLASAALKDAIKAGAIHADVMGSDHCPISVTLDV